MVVGVGLIVWLAVGVGWVEKVCRKQQQANETTTCTGPGASPCPASLPASACRLLLLVWCIWSYLGDKGDVTDPLVLPPLLLPPLAFVAVPPVPPLVWVLPPLRNSLVVRP